MIQVVISFICFSASGQWQDRLLYIDYEEDKKVYFSHDDIRYLIPQYIDLSENIKYVRAFKTKLMSWQYSQLLFYHMFVVFSTETRFYSIEKNSEVIMLQRSKSLQTLKQRYNFGDRKTTPEFMKQKGGRGKVKDLIDWIYNENEINYSYYSMQKCTNCQGFGDRVYDILTKRY